jgi:HSP20 family protein
MAIERWKPQRGLLPWNPYMDIADMERQVDRIFGDSLFPSIWSRIPESKAWFPDLDVFEKDGKFVIKAEIPGMEEKDIDVSIDGDVLTIKGEKKIEQEVKEEDYYRSERSYGSFSRSIPLLSSIDKEKVEADYHNGVLEVTLPKIAAARPKKVKVAAGKKAVKK